MKRFVGLILVFTLLLAGCTTGTTAQGGTANPPQTETRLVYFSNFGVLEGKDVAFVQFVDTKNGEYVETDQKGIYHFADNVTLQSFDLRENASPTDASIKKMDFPQFKEAALLLKGASPIVYILEVANDTIYSARSGMTFFPARDAAQVFCPNCGKVFQEGAEFDNHECIVETTAPAETAPATEPTQVTETTAPAPTEAPKTKQCPVCAEWFAEGDTYLHHECIGYRVACYDCGNWYQAGYEFLTHKCTPSTKTTTKKNSNTNKPTSQPVQCSKCKLWFDNYTQYGNHHCQGTGGQVCYGCGQYFATTYEYDTHRCPGNIVEEDYPCGYCGLVFATYQQFANHHCQGTGGQTCYGCGQYFSTTYDYDTHKCPANVQPVMVQCEVCGQWLEEGNMYRSHMLNNH